MGPWLAVGGITWRIGAFSRAWQGPVTVCASSSGDSPAARWRPALAFTRGGNIVLVKLSYAEGWRAPGGGIGRRETPEQAILRELSEEIGMTSHAGMRRINAAGGSSDLTGGPLFLVTGVEYQPHSSWEIAAVGEFALDALPPDLSTRARAWIDGWVRLCPDGAPS